MAQSPVISLILRVLAFIFLFISLIILITTSVTVNSTKFQFNDVYAYRYTLFTIVMGIAYTLLQIAFTIYHITMGKRLAEDGLLQFDFYADKIISYTLATGAAAAFGATGDLREVIAGGGTFFDKGNASASLLLLGFLCTAVSSVFSSIALPKYD